MTHRSIEETKREIVRLTRTMNYKERTSLLKKMIRQAVDEVIDREAGDGSQITIYKQRVTDYLS